MFVDRKVDTFSQREDGGKVGRNVGRLGGWVG